MRKLGIIQRDKKLTMFYAIAIAFCALWMTMGILFIVYSRHLSRQETSDHVQASALQTAAAVDSHVQEEFNTLTAAAVAIHARWDTDERDVSFERLVQTLMSHSAYVKVGVASPNGQAMVADRHGNIQTADVSQDPFFQPALAGSHYLSAPEKILGGVSAMYYAVPVYSADSAIIGVLYAADPTDEIRDIVSASLYSEHGLAHVVDRKGNHIVRSDAHLTPAANGNIFETEAAFTREIEQILRDNFAAGRTGHFTHDFGGGNRHIAYAPLARNRWHVYYVTPESMVNARLEFVIVASIVILAVAAFATILFILLIWRITSQKRKALEQIAFVDPLTKQQNSRKFMLDSLRLLRNHGPAGYTVWYYNIRGFKYINALFGHASGNKMLQYLAEYLAAHTSEGELFARAHDDVFFLLRKDTGSDASLQELFDRDARHLAAFPQLASEGFHAELGAGVCRADECTAPEALQELMDCAEGAHDAARAVHGKLFGIYTIKMRNQKIWETEMEAHQDAALANGEFTVYWQPKISIRGGESIHGMESLVRWDYPGKGTISPGEFIPLFEQNGFIAKLDLFVFEESCRLYAAHGLAQGPHPLVMSVNVSRIGMRQPGFMETYAAIKDKYHIPPGCVELEFTESLAFENHDRLADIITALHQNGFLCSLDDFGSGYSSLNILKSLQVDVLKLDREFCRFGCNTERSYKLVKSVIALANELGMQTVAEGVDDKDTVNILRRVGCGMVQGYVYARPMPPEEFLLYLQSWASAAQGAS